MTTEEFNKLEVLVKTIEKQKRDIQIVSGALVFMSDEREVHCVVQVYEKAYDDRYEIKFENERIRLLLEQKLCLEMKKLEDLENQFKNFPNK